MQDNPAKDLIPYAGQTVGFTETFLVPFLERQDASWRAGDRAALEALCRKVDIAKKVWKDYSPDWKTARVKEPLPLNWWPLLVAAFLQGATQAQSLPADERPVCLKFLNSAFRALDLYRAAGGKDFADELEQWADDLAGREIAA